MSYQRALLMLYFEIKNMQQHTTFIANESLPFQYSKKLRKPYGEVVSKITESLERQGFGIITSINVKDTLKKKLGIDFRNYQILGACNPEFAYKIITLDSHNGLMLPCNVLVQEHENGEIELSVSNQLENIAQTLNPELDIMVKEISSRLKMAVDEVN